MKAVRKLVRKTPDILTSFLSNIVQSMNVMLQLISILWSTAQSLQSVVLSLGSSITHSQRSSILITFYTPTKMQQ